MSVSIFNVVKAHELKTLSRNNVFVSLFSVMFLLLISSLWIGGNMLQRQQRTIGKIRQFESATADSLQARILRIEANHYHYPGFIWDDPTYAYNTARNEGPQFAIKQPFSLQALNVGQSDVQPYYYRVSITKKQQLTYEAEIENGFLQFLGNFDFSFVVVYLFPLVIIVFTYNILSSEKEQGTWVLLKTSNQSIAKLILYRILIRFVLFSSAFWLIVVPVLYMLIGGDFLFSSNWWWLFVFVTLYFAFWFGVSFLVNSFSLRSNVNAMTLIFIWLITGIIIPNILQVALQQIYPVPSRISLLNEERTAINHFYQRDGQSLTKDVFSNPKAMIRQASVVTPGMVFGYGVIAFTSQEIKEKAAKVVEEKLYGQIRKQQEAIGKTMMVSPALMLQEQLSALTGTHWRQFNRFSLDADTFRTQTQRFFVPKMQSEKTYRSFTVADASHIPRFATKTYHSYRWPDAVVPFTAYLLAIFLLVFSGYRRLLTEAVN